MPRPITVPRLAELKKQSQKITMITAYDHSSALLADASGIDVILVGDSLGMVVQGHDTTLPVTLDESLYHTRIVARTARRALVIGDLPFGTYFESVEQAVRNGTKYIKGGANAVKLEGGVRAVEQIRALTRAQVPVQAHIGLTPQSVNMFGGYKVQRLRDQLLDDARAVQDAGAFSVVLECMPGDIAEAISQELEIPTIGIGAGAGCDGQVLVWHDLLGIGDPDLKAPRFVKRYANLHGTILAALSAFSEDVRSGAYPAAEHTYE